MVVVTTVVPMAGAVDNTAVVVPDSAVAVAAGPVVV